MLQTMSSSIVSGSISTSKNGVKQIGAGNMVDEVDIVGKVNMRASKSGTEFFTLEARLSFAKLR